MLKRIVLSVCAAVAAAVVAQAETYTWIGGSAAWTEGANWRSSGGETGTVPRKGDSVILPAPSEAANTYTVTATDPISVVDFTIGTAGAGEGCKATFEVQTLGTNVVSGNLVVNAGGVMTHKKYTGSTQDYALNVSVTGTVTVKSGGSITTLGKGFSNNRGPGIQKNWTSNINPITHGGRFYYREEEGKTDYAPCYGSPTHPVTAGCAGREGGNGGGGVIRLMVAGALTVEEKGSISSNGEPPGYFGAGCGGSVWVSAKSLAGSGLITANGATCARHPASGGRVAVYVENEGEKPFGNVACQAFGGSGGGPAGTVYLCAGPNLLDGTLVIDNNGYAPATTKNPYTELDAANMTDAERFGSIIVTNKAQFNIVGGTHVKLSGDFRTNGGTFSPMDPAASLTFVSKDVVSHISGANTFGGLICTTPGKQLVFGNGKDDSTTIAAGGAITFLGDEDQKISLAGADSSKAWTFTRKSNVSCDIAYVAVAKADSSAGEAILAIASDDLGENQNWAFSGVINPGDPVAWNGSAGTAWSDAENWTDKDGGHRTPIETDLVTIPAGAANYPVLTDGTTVLSNLTIAASAGLSLEGGHLTVMGDLTVNGGLSASDTERITCFGNVGFAAATSFARGKSFVILTGDGAQTLTSGGVTFWNLNLEKSGGSVSFADGFAAEQLTVSATDETTLTFASGATYAVNGLALNGTPNAYLTLGSSAQVPWKLTLDEKSAARQFVQGVKVSGSDASDGATIRADVASTGVGENPNWTFLSDKTAVWTGLGGTSAFATAENWNPQAVPDATTSVLLPGGAKKTSLKVTAPLHVAEAIDFGFGTSAVLDKPVTAGGDVVFRRGATVTHDGHSAGTLVNKVDVSAGRDLLIESGATIDVTGKGFSVGQNGPTQASHGGTLGGGGKPCYDSVFAPMTCGSNGRGDRAGGAVRLVAAGAVVVNGTISADGTYAEGDAVWTGAGGSILISGKTVTGAGPLSACGGSGSANVAGGGGRISIVGESGYTGSVDASSGVGRSVSGGAGSVYRQEAGAPDYSGTILFKSTWAEDLTDPKASTGYSELPMSDDGNIANYKDAAIVCDAGCNLRVLKSFTVRDVNVCHKSARIYLGTNTLTVMSREHKKGKGWADAPENIVVTATDPTTGVKGKIVWAGGLAIIVR